MSRVCWRRAAALGLAALLALASGVFAQTSTPGLSIAHCAADVEAADRVALLALDIRLVADADGWRSIRLMPSGVTLRSAEVAGGQSYLQNDPDGCVAHVRGPGEFKVRLAAVLDVAVRGVERSLRLPHVPAAAARWRVRAHTAGQSFAVAPECPLQQSEENGRSTAVLYPVGTGDAFTVRWMPRAESRPAAPLFEAHESARLSLGAGGARRATDLAVLVRRGEVEECALALPQGLDVLDVSAPPGGPVVQSWRVEETRAARRLILRLARPAADRFVLRILGEHVFNAPVAVISPLVLEGALRQTGRFVVAGERFAALVDAGSLNVTPAPAARPASEGERSYEFVKLPAELRLRALPAAARVTSAAAAYVRLQAGVVEATTRFDLRVENSPLDRFRIALDEGMVVLDVVGDELDRWSLSDGVIEVRPARPILGNWTLTVRCLQNLRRVNGALIPRLRCLDAERESGVVAVSAAADVALQHHRAQRAVQIEPDRLPDWLRRLKPRLAYLYDQPEGLIAVATNLIQPVLRVEALGVARVHDDVIREEHLFLCRVERRPLFTLLLRLPEGLSVVSLAGRDIQDWEAADAGRAVAVTLRRGIIGPTQLQLVAERRLDADRSRLPLGGVAVMGAESLDGWFGVVADANVDLRPVEARGLAPEDIRRAPPFLSAFRNLRLAWRWSSEDWLLRCAGTPVLPRIEADVRCNVLFTHGAARVRSDVTWRIARARVSRLRLALPPGATDLAVSGENLRAQEDTPEGCLLLLDDPVRDDFTLSVSYVLLPDASGRVEFRPPGLPDAERLRGGVGIWALNPQIEVAPRELHRATRAESAPRLDPAAPPPIAAYAWSEHDPRILFDLKNHALAEGLLLAADRCRLDTVVKDSGQAVTYFTGQVRHAGAQFFSLALPPGAQLWGAYVQGRPVRPSRAAEGRIQVPIQDAPRDRPFDVALIWAEPVAPLGLGGRVRLASPQLALPAQAVDWNLFLPADYRLLRAEGNMTPVFRESWRHEGIPGWTARQLQDARPAVRVALKWGGGLLVVLLLALGLWLLIRLRLWLHALRVARGAKPLAKARLVVETLALLVILLLLAGMLLPSLSRAREESRAAACRSNLSQIIKAILLYMEANQDRMPPSLMALYPAYLDNLSVFRCPQTGDPFAYEYSGPLDPARRSAQTAVAWDKAGNHPGRMNVATLDGRVRGLHLADAQNASISSLGQIVRAAASYMQPGGDFFPVGIGRGKLAADDEIGQRTHGATSSYDPSPPAATPAPAPVAPPPKAPGRAAQREQAVVERQIAQSYLNRGDLEKAELHYRRLLENSPASQEAQENLKRISDLKLRLPGDKDGRDARLEEGRKTDVGGIAPDTDGSRREGNADAFLHDRTRPVPAEAPAVATWSAGALAAYAQQLNRAGLAGWQDQVAEAGLQRDLLALVAGERAALDLPGGGRVELKEGDLAVRARADERRSVEEAATALRERMLARTREVAADEKRRQADVDARRRAEMELRRMLHQGGLETKTKAGTLTGSRGAGVTPLEISFPSFGTRPCAFHMDYAGVSQARVEVSCIRAGVALTAQGFLALAALVLLALVAAWRPWVGGGGALLTLALCAWILFGEDDAVKPYAVMLLAGACAALLLVAAQQCRFAFLARRRARTPSAASVPPHTSSPLGR